jgi:acyl-CoA thioester hydrolase
MGVVYHSNFLIYFEIGRTDYFRDLGFTYRAMEADNIFMPVTECYCQFKLPAYYDDELDIETSFEMLSRIRLKFTYSVTRKADSRLIADGYTVHVPVNRSGAPCRIPSPYLEALTETAHIKGRNGGTQ